MPLIITPRQLTLRAQFYQQFGQLLAAGVTVVSALEMLSRDPPSQSFRQPIRQMISQLSSGATVSDAMRGLGHWMPTFDISLVQAGEHSGRLDATFRLLADYYQDRALILRQMITDLAYPAFVFHLAILIFPFIKLFSGGTLLTYLEQTLGVLVPLYVLIFVLIYASQGRRGAQWRAFMEGLLRPVPVLGTGRHFLALARLAAALEALITAGVTIIEAWELAATASGSPALERTVKGWKSQVVAGRLPSEVVSSSRQFPELFANLYHTGEVSGQLDDSLRRLRIYYQEEGSRKLHLLAQWVPRAIYFGIAIMVGYKVFTFYSNYLKDAAKAGGY